MRWRIRTLKLEEAKQISTVWTLDGLDFPVEVVQLSGNRVYEARCEGFEALRGIVDHVAAQRMAISYAKQRLVQLNQEKLDELTALAGD